MLSLEEAQSQILAQISLSPIITLDVSRALGHWLAGDIQARANLPPFDNSAMDGYAVASRELADANDQARRQLRCAFQIPAGIFPDFELGPSECARIFTGSVLPKGADAVVMQEEVQVRGDSVEFHDAIKPFENVRLRGEDIREDEIIGRAGERVTPSLIATLCAAGVAQVQVRSRAKVLVLATGNELTESGQDLKPGSIYESNRAMLAAYLEEGGAQAIIAPLVEDTLAATRQALQSAFAQADIVISTGGVSVGQFDLVKEAFEAIGGQWDFWRVALKPGKPFVFGRLKGKLLFGLPGNPISAAVTFLLLVRPAILKMQGAGYLHLPVLHGILAERLANDGDRPHFIRAKLSSDGLIHTAGPQASHLFRSFARANVLVKAAPHSTMEAGEKVEAFLIGKVED